MSLFGKEDKAKEKALKAAAERRKELERIVKSAPQASLPSHERFKPFPTEYREFLKEIRKKPFSKYEKAANFSRKIFPFKLKHDWAGIDSAAKAGYLAVDGAGVLAFTLITAALLFAVTIAVTMLALGSALILLMLVVTATGTWLVWNRPKSNAKAVTMRMSADSVLAILYMVIYMRTSPNMEGALRFSAETLSGPLSWDLKKLLWDIQLGVWPSADEALAAYATRWKHENEEFAEAINLIRGSAVEPGRRAKMFDEIIELILRGTAERTKHYVGGLRMPVMVIHAMGVLLPVMGLVLFPILVIFMADSISPMLLFIGYDVLLPIFLLLIIDSVLKARPPTFSQPDISLAKGVPPLGKLRIGQSIIPVWPIAVAAAAPLMIVSILGMGGCLFTGEGESCSAMSFDMVNLSLLSVVAAGMGIALYCLLDSWQKMKVRNSIERIEREFGVALFQLGSAISGGTPIELAIDKAAGNLKGMAIAELLATTSGNMRKFGHTFEQALFDPSVGAVWYYPSKLIRSIMVTILEASKRGTTAASDAMVTISNYLRGVHAVKEEVEEVLGETLSSMRFLAMFLTPMVAGVTITMAVIIIRIIVDLSAQLGTLMQSGSDVPMSTGMFVLPWLQSGGISVTPAMFQLIVGIYMLEISIILSMFLNRIQFGEDAVGLRSVIGQTLLISMFVYALSWMITFSMFGSSIQGLLVPMVQAGGT